MKTFETKMKNNVRLMALVLMLSLSAHVWAGNGADVAEKMHTYASLMEDFEGKTITKMNSALLTSDSNSMDYTATLYSGNDYVVYAFGDNRIKDTDLIVYRKDSSGSWVEVKKDIDENNLAIVKFHCYSGGQYKFKIKAYKFESGYTRGYYGLIIGY